jgi:hypothetical protein
MTTAAPKLRQSKYSRLNEIQPAFGSTSGSAARRRTGDASDVRFGSGVFAPLLRPPDLVGGTSGLHDGPLIGGVECLARLDALPSRHAGTEPDDRAADRAQCRGYARRPAGGGVELSQAIMTNARFVLVWNYF